MIKLQITKDLDAHTFDQMVAIRCLCADYHSGLWSRGYRILSKIVTWGNPGNCPITRDELTEEWLLAAIIYDELEEKYKDKL